MRCLVLTVFLLLAAVWSRRKWNKNQWKLTLFRLFQPEQRKMVTLFHWYASKHSSATTPTSFGPETTSPKAARCQSSSCARTWTGFVSGRRRAIRDTDCLWSSPWALLWVPKELHQTRYQTTPFTKYLSSFSTSLHLFVEQISCH